MDLPNPAPTVVRVLRSLRGWSAAASLLALLGPADRAAAAPVPAGRATVTVFAAASLTEPFEELGALFRKTHPGYDVTFDFAGTPQLAAQIRSGAAADVFASADERWMRAVVARSQIDGAPRIFARNRMAVIVPAANRAAVHRLEDLAREGLRIVVCDGEVPAGFHARQVIANLAARPGFPSDYAWRVTANLVSQEENVKGVLGKVRLGEADAGIVYRTDVTKAVAHEVKVLPLPEEANVTATYPVGIVARAPQREGARAFVELLLSSHGRAVLARHGFRPPADASK
jgi:molybdate transport system substrate-binding protein